MIPGIAANPYQGRPTSPRHLFRARQDGWILHPKDHSSLWIDEARTQNATLPGDVVWWIDDKSPNQNHFGAVSSAARGRLYRWPASAVLEGYPRNLLINTEDYAQWSTSGGETVFTTGISDPFGGNNAVRIEGIGGNFGRFAISSLNKVGDLVVTFWCRCVGPVLQSTTNRYRIASTGQDVLGYFRDQLVEDTWVKVELPVTFSIETAALTFRMLGAVCDFYFPQSEVGTVPTPYQRVGSGIWDVTEEGQEDCWGIGFDGVTTQYLSSRGIPLFVDGRLAIAVGQTKLGFDSGIAGLILTNQNTSSSPSGASIIAHTAQNSYQCRYQSGNSSTSLDANTGFSYPSPNSAVMDAGIKAPLDSLSSLKVNNDPEIVASVATGGTINNANWSMGAFRSGINYYNGIIWGVILVAEEPEASKWEIGARQWLSNHNMGGILND